MDEFLEVFGGMRLGTVVAYIIGEGLTDAANAGIGEGTLIETEIDEE